MRLGEPSTDGDEAATESDELRVLPLRARGFGLSDPLALTKLTLDALVRQLELELG